MVGPRNSATSAIALLPPAIIAEPIVNPRSGVLGARSRLGNWFWLRRWSRIHNRNRILGRARIILKIQVGELWKRSLIERGKKGRTFNLVVRLVAQLMIVDRRWSWIELEGRVSAYCCCWWWWSGSMMTKKTMIGSSNSSLLSFGCFPFTLRQDGTRLTAGKWAFFSVFCPPNSIMASFFLFL